MRINNEFEKIVNDLGLQVYHIEKMYPNVKRRLFNVTLSTFSNYFPCAYRIRLNLPRCKSEFAGIRGTLYHIEDKFLDDMNLQIKSVINLTGTSGFVHANARPVGVNTTDIILNSMTSGVRSVLNVTVRDHKFEPPNRLYLKGYDGYSDLDLILKIPYPNFGSIPDGLEDTFHKLALLDTKILLYPELKMFENMDTADGTIDLKLDGWSNAQEDKEQLLKEWLNEAYPQMVSKTFNYE